VLGEDVEDERGPVEHLDVFVADRLLELALLAGRQFLVEDDHVGAGVRAEGDHLLDLA
jgi:hypothetical protein